MDLSAILLVGGLLTLVALATVRSVRTRRRRWILLVPLFLAVLIARWASYRGAWAEVGLAVLGTVLALGIWWIAYGRRLPFPSDDHIRVWTKDDPF